MKSSALYGSSLAKISEESVSPLEEQIHGSKNVDPENVKTRSTRGLDVNKKCSMCNVNKQENNRVYQHILRY